MYVSGRYFWGKNNLKDTRSKNHVFSLESIHVFLNDYGNHMSEALKAIDKKGLEDAIHYLTRAKALEAKIFVAGNGGSSSIAEHLECDFQKGCYLNGNAFLTRSLCSNTAVLTAIANDIGYDKVFSYQLEMAAVNPLDLLILISSSGNSPNIVEAAKFAKETNMVLIGLTGFDGGRLKEMADISIHIPFNNYGLVEDCHQAIMHILAQYIYLKEKEVS